jgi:hypothetical protein
VEEVEKEIVAAGVVVEGARVILPRWIEKAVKGWLEATRRRMKEERSPEEQYRMEAVQRFEELGAGAEGYAALFVEVACPLKVRDSSMPCAGGDGRGRCSGFCHSTGTTWRGGDSRGMCNGRVDTTATFSGPRCS